MTERAGAVVLVVEDDAACAQIQGRALRRAGYAARVTERAGEAVELLARKRFAAVVLDDSLPDGAPWPVLDAARASLVPVPVIMVATTGDPRLAAEARRRGAADCVIKRGDYAVKLPGMIDRAIRLAAAGRLESLRQAIAESSNEAVISVSLDGTVTRWNQGAESTYGYTAAEAVGRSILRLMPPGHPDEAPEILSRLAGGEKLCHYDTTRLSKQGTSLEVSLSLSPLPDDSGRAPGMSKIAHDIGERQLLAEGHRRTRELEQQRSQALESSRLKSQYLVNMSHELRTPLNAILGFAELLHDGKAGEVNERQQRYLGHILRSSQHLLELINGLLDLAKVEAGKMELRPQRLSPARLAEEVIEILRLRAAEHRVQIELELDPALDEVMADPAKLKQILFNFVSNALKHTPPEGRVTVRVLAQGAQQFRLEVQDTGKGIPADQMARLFTDFQQLAGTGEQPAGTGLGLAVTKRLVEAQGGTVGANSAPGAGSLFFATLPQQPKRRTGALPVLVRQPLPAPASPARRGG